MTGTISIAEAISKCTVEKSLISILGGGDTLAAINKSKNKLYIARDFFGEKPLYYYNDNNQLM